MVAYSFKPSFVPLIQAGQKQQTIRRPRKRHARPGEALQLLTGPRMRPTRVGYAVCQAVRDVLLNFLDQTVTLGSDHDPDGELITDADALDAFALRDGFASSAQFAGMPDRLRPWALMRRWWAMTHPEQIVFLGVMITWGDTFQRPVFVDPPAP